MNAANRLSRFVFSPTSITGETNECDSPFTNTPAEEVASVKKKNQKERLVEHQRLVNAKEEYMKTKTGLKGSNSRHHFSSWVKITLLTCETRKKDFRNTDG